MSVRRIAVFPLVTLPVLGAALTVPAVASASPAVSASRPASRPAASGEVLHWLPVVAARTGRLAARYRVHVASVFQEGRCAVKSGGAWTCQVLRVDAGRVAIGCALTARYQVRAGRRVHVRIHVSCRIGAWHAVPRVAGTPFQALAAFVSANPFSLTAPNVPHPDQAATASRCIPAVRHGQALYACYFRVSARQLIGHAVTLTACKETGTVRFVHGRPVVGRKSVVCSASSGA